MKIIYVSNDGSRKYSSIQKAVDSLMGSEEEATIIVCPGIYNERVNCKRSNLSIISLDPDNKAVIRASEYAFRELEGDEKVGTFRTATFMADCDDFTAENIIFENAAGQGADVGQAIALYADGQRQKYKSCEILGYQDTVFLAPLPEKEMQKNGFIGEKQFMERRPSDIKFIDCRIEGNIDYIFGGAKAVFMNCTLFTRKRKDDGPCYVTAASTPEGQETGFVFKNCRFKSDATKGTVFLGRPWREYAKTELINCYLDDSIAPKGWNDWNKPHGHFQYSEKDCFGPGADTSRREDFVRC